VPFWLVLLVAFISMVSLAVVGVSFPCSCSFCWSNLGDLLLLVVLTLDCGIIVIVRTV